MCGMSPAVGGRPVVINLSVRRLYCENPACPQATFAEQIDGLTVRYQRRTPALQRVLDAVAVALVGKAGAHLLAMLHQQVSWATLLHGLMALPVPQLPVPRVPGVDDFALRRGHRYATILIDALTHRMVGVLPDHKADTLAAWLREHPQVEVVCRDGSASYAQAVADALPDAVQVSDRWHLWNTFGKAAEKTVTAHASCWRAAPQHAEPGSRNEHTLQRHAAVHTLLAQGAGLLETARRLRLALNTVKRYARVVDAAELVRPPRPAWSTPTVTTCAYAAPRAGWRPPFCWPRSGRWVTPAAPTCWCATSTRAVPRTRYPSRPYAASPPGS
ncbi:MAG TPA: ISL3 family transposase [Streptomyces sp.]|nr:ISL3 family transposase [Streptomyces sp.]